jgi:glycosyltransferase involved in cell wall biosynthesis
VTPAVSVIVCTRNRADHLRLAVASLVEQTLPVDAYEVVVVDNGSTDGTAETLRSLVRRIPNLRILTETTLGLSQARNTGAKAARGDIVVFVDDDAVADPELLEAHRRRFELDDPPVATGGRIRLRWPDARPAWLPAGADSLYSGLDLGDEARPMEYPVYPYGANMAIARDVLLALGGFSLVLGRHGRNLLSGEERDLFRRLASGHGRVDYVPDARVEHHVLADRAGLGWYFRRAYAQGRSDAITEVMERGGRSRVQRTTRSGQHVRGAVSCAWRGAAAYVRGDTPAAAGQTARGLRRLGAAVQGWRDLTAHSMTSSGE